MENIVIFSVVVFSLAVCFVVGNNWIHYVFGLVVCPLMGIWIHYEINNNYNNYNNSTYETNRPRILTDINDMTQEGEKTWEDILGFN